MIREIEDLDHGLATDDAQSEVADDSDGSFSAGSQLISSEHQ